MNSTTATAPASASATKCRKILRTFIPLLLAAALLGGCAAPPHLKPDSFAQSQNMNRQLIQGEAFTHVVYTNGSLLEKRLHVYIEGDGKPWVLNGQLPARDPTPRYPLTLYLMSRDPDRAIYLGRPCYLDTHTQAPCTEKDWTSGRFSQDIVDSLAAALENHLSQHPATHITLIGYSGGGALATLMAGRLKPAVRLITLAGNLDTAQWTHLHGYLPLHESLNPMVSAQLEGVLHLHFAGGRDTNIPAEQIANFARKHGGQFILLPEFDHRCCWEDKWPELLHNSAQWPK